MRAHAHECVCERERVRICACVHMCVCVHVCVCALEWELPMEEGVST